MRITKLLLFGLALGACTGDADTLIVELAPSIVSSLDGTIHLSALVAAGTTPLPGEAVHATIAYGDRNGAAHDIAPIDGTTDDRGVFHATIEGLAWDGTGTVTVESGSVTNEATFAVLDRTPPKIEILPPTTDNHVGPGLPLEVLVHVRDEIGVAEITLDANGPISGGRTTIITSATADKTLSFRLSVDQNAAVGPTITLLALARDVSGNLAAADAVTLTVDPAITIATPPGLVGTLVTTGTQTQLADPRSIVVSPKDGKLYVADAGQQGACNGGCIWRVDATTGAIDAAPIVVGQGTIEGVALDATGDNLYYSDRQDRTGRLTWNGTAYTGAVVCNNTNTQRPQDPFHLVFDATLGLLAIDGNQGEVDRIATCAAATNGTTFSTGNNAFDEPRGIALGATGEIYVSDRARDRISMVDRTTGAVTSYATVREPYGIEWLGGTSMWGNHLMVASTGDRVIETAGNGPSLTSAFLREPPIDLAFASGTMFVITEPVNATRGRIYRVTGF